MVTQFAVSGTRVSAYFTVDADALPLLARFTWEPWIEKGGDVESAVIPKKLRTGAEHEISMHRYLARELLGPPPAYSIVKFKNGNKRDCRRENLRWVPATPRYYGA